MGENLLTVFKNTEGSGISINADEIVSMEMGTHSRTGKLYARATLDNGTTYIQSLSRTGVKEGKIISIPSFNNREERREIVIDLKEQGYTQDEIANMCGISQSTVHNDLKRKL